MGSRSWVHPQPADSDRGPGQTGRAGGGLLSGIVADIERRRFTVRYRDGYRQAEVYCQV